VKGSVFIAHGSLVVTQSQLWELRCFSSITVLLASVEMITTLIIHKYRR